METFTKIKSCVFQFSGENISSGEQMKKILLSLYKLERVSQGNSCKCRQHSIVLDVLR